MGSRLGSLPPVVPVFVFGLGTPVHGALVGYKAGATASGRAVRAAALAEVLGEWLERHAACLLGDAGEAMLVPVPSSAGGRASWHGRHPLEGLCASAAPRSGRLRPEPVLLPGPEPPRRLQASRRGFVVENPGSLSGRTALVVDDMFVSGSRILSAAAALTDAGVRVTAAVPIGRLVRPDHNAATYAYWGDRSATPFDPAICPRCAPGRGRRRVSAFGTGLASVSQRLAA
ncbi:MAG: phosphoribosyltransferase [Acidimicrobiales bacterium]